MNRKQIEDMTEKEHQELRESVWRIMGWTPWVEEEYPFRSGWSLLNGEGDKSLECDMADPTTDQAAAMEVIKRCLKKSGYGLIIDIHDDAGFSIEQRSPLNPHSTGDETLELTICKFAQKLFSK